MDRPGTELGEFAGRWAEAIRKAWDGLPQNRRAELARVLGILPVDLVRWRRLVEEAAAHLHLAAADRQTVAIVGPANAGKSTLYNQLIRASEARAAVSAVPGTTRQAQAADAGIFTVVDTPGADAVGAVGQEERDRALQAARGADLLLVVFDAVHGIRAAEKSLFDELISLEKPAVVVLNKMDLVARQRAAVLGKAAAGLEIPVEQLVPISAKTGAGVERLLAAVAKSEPGIVAALGQALPGYRRVFARAAIGRAASTAAAIAVTPLPIMDFVPLIAVQSAMVLGLARIYAYQLTPARARELLVTFGIGLLARNLFYELLKFGGPPGWLVAAAVAAGTTTALGYGAQTWFERGERLSRERLQALSRSVGERVAQDLRGLGRRRPKREAIQQRVAEALQEETAPTEPERNTRS
ncbi:MAG TPA: GTPase [Anaerolineales bacterium]|nr:GTPase [Anaerolineales bacterium]